jgi:hypothetical protein
VGPTHGQHADSDQSRPGITASGKLQPAIGRPLSNNSGGPAPTSPRPAAVLWAVSKGRVAVVRDTHRGSTAALKADAPTPLRNPAQNLAFCLAKPMQNLSMWHKNGGASLGCGKPLSMGNQRLVLRALERDQ